MLDSSQSPSLAKYPCRSQESSVFTDECCFALRVVKQDSFLKEIFHVNGSIFCALQSKDIIANKKENIHVFIVVIIYVYIINQRLF
jgi:hypothetical protein